MMKKKKRGRGGALWSKGVFFFFFLLLHRVNSLPSRLPFLESGGGRDRSEAYCHAHKGGGKAIVYKKNGNKKTREEKDKRGALRPSSLPLSFYLSPPISRTQELSAAVLAAAASLVAEADAVFGQAAAVEDPISPVDAAFAGLWIDQQAETTTKKKTRLA